MKSEEIKGKVISKLLRIIDEINYDISETHGETLKNVEIIHVGNRLIAILLSFVNKKEREVLFKLRVILNSKKFLSSPEDFKGSLDSIEDKLKVMSRKSVRRKVA